jgi:CHAD domain-containing protein
MSFCIQRDESVSHAVRRLGCERVEEALHCLANCRDAEAIHCVRKELKKARALLELVRGEIPGKARRRATLRLRDAAKLLAPMRDAFVLTKALEGLTEHYPRSLTPAVARPFRVPLQKALLAEIKRYGTRQTASKVRVRLHQTATEFESLVLRRKGWKALGPGMQVSYRKARRAFRAARKQPLPENRHHWRTRTKRLWYQMRLLEPVASESIKAMTKDLEALSELLGEDHDLYLLNQTVAQDQGAKRPRKGREILLELIGRRQRKLQTKAWLIGARCYGEKPTAFWSRLGRSWRIRRHSKKSARSSAGAASPR